MSGAAGIAAAKNRRSKPDPNQKPIISCSSKTGSCPLPPSTKQPSAGTKVNSLIDSESLQINGPMPLMQVLKVHEQRLNKIDEKIKSIGGVKPQQLTADCTTDCTTECSAECIDRIAALEEKVLMLEEVIMNLQLTLTNVQSFAMETSLAMMKIQNQVATVPISTPIPTSPVMPENSAT